jgi:hypothetical protein
MADVVSYLDYMTEEEYAAELRQDEDQFYADLIRYIRGEPHDLSPGRVGMLKAEIAKAMVDRAPHLLAPEHRSALLAAVEDAFSRKHTVRGRFTERQMAQAILLVTGPDKLQG